MKRTIIALTLFAGYCLHGMAQSVLSNDFSTVAQFERYTVVDQNQDGQTWQYDDLMLAARSVRDFDADDWLMSPSLRLSAAKTYKLTLTANIEQEGSEQLAVHVGSSPTVSAMTQTLRTFDINRTSSASYEVIFTVSTTGNYRVGFHHKTQDDFFSNALCLNSIVIEETVNQSVPAAVSDLLVEADADGQPQVSVSFTTPQLTVDGRPLPELTSVVVYRDKTAVKTFDAPGIGTPLTYVDEGMADGSHTYRVVPVNSYGEGISAQATVYVGLEAPGPVENLRFVYDQATQQATITWDAPTTGAHGGKVSLDGLTYEVRRFHAETPEATGLSESTFTDVVGLDFLREAEEAMRKQYENIGMPVSVNYVVDGQGLMQYYVRAVTAKGRGTETTSNSVIIGEQYQLPFADSFAEGKLSHYWRTDIRTRQARWSAIADSRYPQDGDNGLMGINAVEGNESGMCHTGCIDMTAATAPALVFYYYYDYAWAKPLTIKVSKDGGAFETLTTVDLSNENLKERWNRACILLDGCAGHSQVQVAFAVETSTTVDALYIDNVLIMDQRANDLAVRIASLPGNLKVGETRYMTAAVENLGTADVALGQYTVNVYVDGLKAGSSMGMAVGAGQTQSVMVPLTATIDMQASTAKSQTSDIYAEVVYAADEHPENNSTDVQQIKVKLPGYPEATALTAALTDGGVDLSWLQPAAPRTEDSYVTDSFEDYADFQRTPFGDWQLYDGDRALTYAIGGWKFPKHSDLMSWMVWTPSEVESTTGKPKGLVDKLWYPRTGDKMLASFGAFDTKSDDWLISPELSGNQQIISFYAHSLPKASNVDQFQLYISTTGAEVTNFMALDAQPRIVPDFKNETFDLSKWEDCKFEYILPQGTKYFAIRKVTNDGWAMFVDDITFAPDTLAAQTNLMLFGYNVYKNGARLNTSLVPTPAFSDAAGKAGDVYRVTAVYNMGESIYTEAVVAALEGDVNGDGEVGIGDIVAITNVMAAPAGSSLAAAADVNGDGEVGIGDIIAVTNIMAGAGE